MAQDKRRNVVNIDGKEIGHCYGIKHNKLAYTVYITGFEPTNEYKPQTNLPQTNTGDLLPIAQQRLATQYAISHLRSSIVDLEANSVKKIKTEITDITNGVPISNPYQNALNQLLKEYKRDLAYFEKIQNDNQL